MADTFTFHNPYTGLEAYAFKAGREAGRTGEGEIDDRSAAYQDGLWQGRLERMAHQQAQAAQAAPEVGTPEWAATITAEQAVELPYRHYKMWRDIKQTAKETDTLRRTGWDFTPKAA